MPDGKQGYILENNSLDSKNKAVNIGSTKIKLHCIKSALGHTVYILFSLLIDHLPVKFRLAFIWCLFRIDFENN